MKLTRASSYALHALAHLAQQNSGKPVASHLIAADRGIPERFLLKVLKPLVSTGVLASVKGPHGGYRLRGPLDSVSLLEVVEAVDGPIRMENSFAERSNAALNGKLETVCRTTTEVVRGHLQSVRISDLVAGKKVGGASRRQGKAPGG
jgi:Rrf2 family transcriptional regulator, iron-sulfur cluster assembly transcription factor